MSSRTALSSALGWKCPQCTVRTLSTTARQLQVGPEHPRYVAIPEPPQQTLPYPPRQKGVLPVPRDIFSGTTRDQSADEAIADATKRPQKERTPAKGSREEWKAKMSEARRQNLREGLKSLRYRQQVTQQRERARSNAKMAEREELLARPEREDERLTAPSNNLDLEALLHGQVPDPTRRQRLAAKRINLQNQAAEKQQERMDALHTLYMNARTFIVTPEQLDKAVDEAFGSEEQPKIFGSHFSSYDTLPIQKSIWAEGRPERVQDMLNKANGLRPRSAIDSAGGLTEVNKERIKRIAETLTGGKMDEVSRQ